MEQDIHLHETAPRDIVITNDSLEYGNIEAWKNIIESYQSTHPDHQVVILYEGEEVHNILAMFKMDENPNRFGFQLVVRGPDGNWKDVPKLYRFLVEGGSNKYNRYIEKGLYQVLKLF